MHVTPTCRALATRRRNIGPRLCELQQRPPAPFASNLCCGPQTRAPRKKRAPSTSVFCHPASSFELPRSIPFSGKIRLRKPLMINRCQSIPTCAGRVCPSTFYFPHSTAFRTPVVVDRARSWRREKHDHPGSATPVPPKPWRRRIPPANCPRYKLDLKQLTLP